MLKVEASHFLLQLEMTKKQSIKKERRMIVTGNAMGKSFLVAFLTALSICVTVASAQLFNTAKAATNVTGIMVSCARHKR